MITDCEITRKLKFSEFNYLNVVKKYISQGKIFQNFGETVKSIYCVENCLNYNTYGVNNDDFIKY